MSTTYGVQMLPYYARASATFATLPCSGGTSDSGCVIVDDGGTNPQCNGLDATGLPQFQVPLAYTLSEDEGLHESSHAMKRALERLYSTAQGYAWSPTSTDPRAKAWTQAAFWDARWRNADGSWPGSVPTTWDAQRAIADCYPNGTNQQWMNLPDEIWAEDLKNVLVGHFVAEKTVDYGITLTQERIDALWDMVQRLQRQLGRESEVAQTQIKPFSTDTNGDTPQASPVVVTWDVSKLRHGKKVSVLATRVGTTGIEPNAPGFLVHNDGVDGDGTYSGAPTVTSSCWIRGDCVKGGTAWGQLTLVQET